MTLAHGCSVQLPSQTNATNGANPTESNEAGASTAESSALEGDPMLVDSGPLGTASDERTSSTASSQEQDASALTYASDAGRERSSATSFGDTDATTQAASNETGTEPNVDGPFERPRLVVSSDNGYWLPRELEVVADDVGTVVVDETVTHQTWLGFSGGLNEAGWNALGALEEEARARALELLFAPSGLHLGMGQIPIGSGESALGRTFPSEVDADFAMDHFSIEHDRTHLVPYIHGARQMNPELTFWAVPWTPPPWMKTNRNSDGGSLRDEPEVQEAYALYLAKFIEAYAELGISIESLHLQTAPEFENHYPSCAWTTDQLSGFAVDYLLPTLLSRELDVELWAGDVLSYTSDVYLSALFDTPQLSKLAGVGLAWGMRAALKDVADQFPVPIFQVQHEHGNAPFRDGYRSTPPNDHAYGVETWRLLHEWLQYSSAYNVVNLALDTQGWNLDSERPWAQNALLVVDRTTRALNVTPAYYVVRHLSQFLDPGASRIEVTPSSDALAFANPNGSIVTVLHNAASEPQLTTLDVRGEVYAVHVPAAGWATVYVE